MKHSLSCLFFLAFTLTPLSAQLQVSKIFSDHAVLQRGLEVPIWGQARPGQTVKVSLDSISFQSEADQAGNWRVQLPPMEAGGPYKLIIDSDTEKVIFQNILVGDVWLCSGQSNMEWAVKYSNNAEQEIQQATDDQIRHFKVPRSYGFWPQDTLKGGKWTVCNPENVGNYTAVGYFFAKELRKHQNVPIGLLNTSWGGSRIEPWMRAETLGYPNQEEAALSIQSYMDSIRNLTKARLEALIGYLPEEDLGMKDVFPLWASPEYNHENWKTMDIPGTWESKGYPELDGIVWFRKEIFLTKRDIEHDLILNLGPIQDADITYFNGHLIGKTNSYDSKRTYSITSNHLREGLNTIAIRVHDGSWSGGLTGKCEDFFYTSSIEQKSLCGAWHFKVGQVDLKNAAMPIRFHTLLYNYMIHPILDYPIKGALWYQGESNGSFADAKNYAAQFETMIEDWRKLWNCGDFPFLWVQLANWQKPNQQPTDTGWARLREAQTKTLENVPNTAQAVIIDIGEADDIHPRNKQDVGYRLALGARKIAYSEALVHSGPLYKSMRIQENKIVLNFELFGSQLMTKDNAALQSFAIAGADQKFYWATAKIVGDQIIVSSPQVAHPLAVRYAWADNPSTANLYNKEGLPASPFRTDSW